MDRKEVVRQCKNRVGVPDRFPGELAPNRGTWMGLPLLFGQEWPIGWRGSVKFGETNRWVVDSEAGGV